MLPVTISLSVLLLALLQAQLFTPASAVLSGLPRFNFYTLTFESSDLGSYNVFDCWGGVSSYGTDDPSADRSCSFNTEDDGLIAYAGGAGFYTAIGVTAGVFLLFGSFFYLLYSLCKCCCGWCCCSLPPHLVKTREAVKPWSILSFFVCLVMIFTCFCVSTFNGNLAITENTSNNEEYSAANSLHGLKNIIHTFEPSATHSLLGSTSNVMRPAVLATNKTLNAAVSIHDLIEAFEIMNVTIPKLPDAHGVVDMLNTTKKIVYNSSDYMDFIIINLDDIDVLVDDMTNSTQALYNQTLNLTSIYEDFSDTISLLNVSVSLTLEFLDEIIGDDGVVSASIDDLQAMQRVEDGGVLPNTEVFQDASTGATASTARLLSAAMHGAPAEIALMNEKLLAIDKNMTALPNYTLTANKLVYLNDSINAALASNGLISNLTSQMNDVGDAVKGPIPILHDITHSISSFRATLDLLVIEMGDTVSILRVMLPLIETLLPQFEFLEGEVEKMFAAEDLLPILDIVVDQFVSINSTLFVLTTPFNDAIDSINDVNATLQDFLYNGTLNEILDQLDDANATITDALQDADEELTNLDDFLDVLEDSINDYNISDITDTIAEAIELLEAIDFEDALSKVAEFEEVLATIQIDEDFVNSLYVLQSQLDLFLGILDRAVGPTGDYTLLAEGICTGHQDVYCSVDSDCTAAGGTTCNGATKGTYRCSSPIGDTLCTADSDCSALDASSYCLADGTRGTTLHAVLVGFADDSTDLEVGDLLADLEDILASSDVQLGNSTRMLEDGADSMDVFNTTDVLTLIREIESGISDFDTESISDQMVTTQESIDDVDFDGFIEQVDSNLDIYDRVSNNTFIEKWIETFETVKDILFKDEFLKSYLASVEGPVLAQVLGSGGPAAAMSHIGAQVDRALEDLRRNQSGISVGEPDEPYANKYEDMFVVLDRAGASRYASTPYAMNDQHGALYYLFALADNFTINNMRTVPYNHPLARGIFANAEGFQYVDDYADESDMMDDMDDDNNTGGEKDSVYCLTFACFKYTMNILNTAPLSEVNAEINPPSNDSQSDDSDGVDVDFSREEVMTLLWAPVLVLLGIGVVSFLLALVPRWYKMHLRCNCCFLSCACLLLPFIFIISSAFFLLAIIGEDSCATGMSIGETYIKDFGDEFCEQTLKGTGTLSECTFNFTVPEQFGDDQNITISLDVLDTYNALFQKECGMETDPFEKIALDLATQVQKLPLKAAQKALAGSDYDLRPSLESIVNKTAVNYGQVMYNLIAETNADGEHKVMSCASMSLVYADLEETGCEGVVMPGVWLIASWYFLAWSICCCGIPASCATLVKTNVVDTSEGMEALDTSEAGSGSYEGEESSLSGEEEGGGVQMQDVHLVQRGDSSSSCSSSDDDDDDEGVVLGSSHHAPLSPPSYTVIHDAYEHPPAAAGARVMSGHMPRPAKESGNSYMDRSSGSARSLGLGGGRVDSRFQSSRR
jgi:hypothetical protein